MTKREYRYHYKVIKRKDWFIDTETMKQSFTLCVFATRRTKFEKRVRTFLKTVGKDKELTDTFNSIVGAQAAPKEFDAEKAMVMMDEFSCWQHSEKNVYIPESQIKAREQNQLNEVVFLATGQSKETIKNIPTLPYIPE
jgi:hypothetical protein